jgi:branched-chain amino acid transport system ATP-binding protein
VLAVENLHTYRGAAHILRGLSLNVSDGEVVCLVGRNGAGKTTTMESIMGLLPVRVGRVEFKNQEITRLPTHARARLGLGYAPEDTGVFPDLTVAENLSISQWQASAAKGNGANVESRTQKIYELFPELPPLVGRKGLYLSGGEKKMVAIARAMALGATILLLDEAFEGLAPVVVNRFAEAVARIKEMGLSLLIAESNIMTAAKVAERLYVIDRGEIIYTGAARDVFENDDVMRTIRG